MSSVNYFPLLSSYRLYHSSRILVAAVKFQDLVQLIVQLVVYIFVVFLIF